MKHLSVLLAGCGLSLSASAQDLSTASHWELLRELGRRLGVDNNSSPALSYICQGNYVYLYLVGPSGKQTEKYFNAGNESQCDVQAKVLNRLKRGSVGQATTVYLCDSSNDLYRQEVKADGSFGDSPYTRIGDFRRCFQQARMLNGD